MVDSRPWPDQNDEIGWCKNPNHSHDFWWSMACNVTDPDGTMDGRLIGTPFKVVVADPPWPFQDNLPGKSRGAASNYDMLNMSQIFKYPVPAVDSHAVLFLWRVASMQEEAIQVCKTWGFKPYTEMVWQKRTAKGKKWFGMGRMLRNSHESVLIGLRSFRPPQKSFSIRSTFDAPYTGHSQKPEEFYDLVEEMLDGPYLELFARRQRKGWTCIGKELDNLHLLGGVA